MAKLSLVKGTTSYRAYVFIQDSSVTTGAGKTGLAYNTSSLTAYYVRPGAAAVAITLATQTATGAYSSGGFVEVDATNMPGVYRLDVPDAALASGVNAVVVMLKGATNMAPCVLEIELTGTDNQDAVRGGMTALPNANAEAAGGLYTRGTGAGQINQPANGLIDANVTRFGGTAGTFASGRPEVNTTHVAGTAQTARDLGGQLDAAVSTRLATSGYTAPPSAATIAAAVWDYLTSAATTVGSLGKLLVDNVNAAISSRLASSGYTAPLDAAGTRAAVGLASANLDTQLSILTGYVDTEVAAIKAKTDNLPASPAATGDIPSAATIASQVRTELTTELGRIDAAVSTRATPAQVNTEVVDALSVDTYAEPGQGSPAATATLAAKINYLYKAWRNKKTQTSSQFSLYADDASTVDQKAAVSSDGTTTTVGEIATGP